ncbi:hypothetical protein GCM10023085_42780 [Actinomadura viridis]|uniref:Tn3 transposase DDE domain-containing protein n=1 Tax=Actinomadura viridis TaxID=58110 RepID=A0A931DEJ6_9ACTN|nr:Tn3 family transposase [Actinomadura viridis]MBG6089639.1 hypothetical protein [Actinomadura viridis]
MNAAIATVVNTFAELDVVKAWRDGTAVAADGSQVETYIDNLPCGDVHPVWGAGGIAYHCVFGTYVALFSRFIPCGVWEAVHLIEAPWRRASASSRPAGTEAMLAPGPVVARRGTTRVARRHTRPGRASSEATRATIAALCAVYRSARAWCSTGLMLNPLLATAAAATG